MTDSFGHLLQQSILNLLNYIYMYNLKSFYICVHNITNYLLL